MQITSLPKNVVPSEIAPEQLANNPALTEKQKIGEASRQFEAILLHQILSATQKTVIQSKFADNSTAGEIYRDMVTNQLADSISKSGAFGLAKTFEDQLTRPTLTEAETGKAGGPALVASTTHPAGGASHPLSGHAKLSAYPSIRSLAGKTSTHAHE